MKLNWGLIIVGGIILGAGLAKIESRSQDIINSKGDLAAVAADGNSSLSQARDAAASSLAAAKSDPKIRLIPAENRQLSAESGKFSQLLAKLPRKIKQDGAKLPIYSTQGFYRAAADLAAVSDYLQRHPGHRPQALRFYQDCGLEQNIMNSFRALCVSKAQKLSLALSGQVWQPVGLSAQVLFLASKM